MPPLHSFRYPRAGALANCFAVPTHPPARWSTRLYARVRAGSPHARAASPSCPAMPVSITGNHLLPTPCARRGHLAVESRPVPRTRRAAVQHPEPPVRRRLQPGHLHTTVLRAAQSRPRTALLLRAPGDGVEDGQTELHHQAWDARTWPSVEALAPVWSLPRLSHPGAIFHASGGNAPSRWTGKEKHCLSHEGNMKIQGQKQCRTPASPHPAFPRGPGLASGCDGSNARDEPCRSASYCNPRRSVPPPLPPPSGAAPAAATSAANGRAHRRIAGRRILGTAPARTRGHARGA